MWFLGLLWRLFDAVFLYPRWFLPDLFPKFASDNTRIPRYVPVWYEWMDKAIISAPLFGIVMLFVILSTMLGIDGRTFGAMPALFGFALYLAFGLYVAVRSFVSVIFDILADAHEAGIT